MNTPLLTEDAKGTESARLNLLNDALVHHAAKGLEAHDSEGPTAYTFTDSGGNNLSQFSLIIGGVDSGSMSPVKVYLPLAQNPIPVPTVSGLFEFIFYGIQFVNEDDFQQAIDTVETRVQAEASLTPDETAAILGLLVQFKYGSIDSNYTQVVNGTSYVIHVTILTATGYISVSYQR